MNAPPIITSEAPQFDLPERPTPRNYVGWVVLTLIVLFIFTNQLTSYLGRDKAEPSARYFEQVTNLKLGVKTKQFGNSSATFFDGIEKDLRVDAEKDAIAARIYAVTLGETHKPVPEKVLAQLRTSKEWRDKVFAEIFGKKTLTPEEAAAYEKKLAKGGYISKLAIAQAYEKAGMVETRDRLLKDNSLLIYGVLGASIVLLGAVAIILWIVYGVRRSQGDLQPRGFPLQHITLADADRLAIRCAQIFGLFLVVPLVVRLFADPVKSALNPSAAGNVLSLVTYVLLVLGTLGLFSLPVMGKRISLADIGIHGRNLGQNIAWGFSVAIANIPIVIAMAMLGQFLFSWLPKAVHPASVELAQQTDWFTLVTLFIGASIGAPILEEIMFRGTLLPALARVTRKPVFSILLQGLIFAIIHPTGIPAWLALGSIGAMSGFTTRQTGALVPSIVMHSVHNFGTLLVGKAIAMLLGF